MAFEAAVISQVVAVADQHKIEPAALLAVVEVESAGKSLEIDGVTPCLLFERHVFYRELKKAGKTAQLLNAQAMGLANATWQPATQYKDQGTSSKRIQLYLKAKAVDEECADRSCSWGVGQTCGFLAEEMRFPNAIAMLAYMTKGGVPAQVECMVREIENKKLSAKLNAHNWAGFAKSYNGPGYAKNAYDTKMAAAYLKWAKQTLTVIKPAPVDVPPEMKPAPVPPPPKVTPTQASIGGIAGAVAAIWAFFNSVEFKLLAFACLIIVLAVITGIVLLRRHASQTERGTLSAVTA